MKRVAITIAAAVCAASSPAAAVARTSPHHAPRLLSGTVTDVEGGTFTVQTGGRRMGVVNAMIARANAITRSDYPYVWGGGHAAAGVASAGSAAPGRTGRRRIGFDCSGSVAAVLAGAGIWPAGAGVPNDAGVIAQLRADRLIAPGAGTAPVEVTLYDDPGFHIFMNIDGRFFGTSDGAGGGNRKGGAGWLYDGHYDADRRAYRKWHILPSVLRDRTVYGHTYTFQSGGVGPLAGALQVGDRVRVGYAGSRAGTIAARSVSWVGAVTATATVSGVSADGTGLVVETGTGRTLTLSSGGAWQPVEGIAAGDSVRITYTRRAGVLTLRSITVLAVPTEGQLSGTVVQVSPGGSSLTVQTSDGRTLTLATSDAAGGLSGVSAGDAVQIAYVQAVTGALTAQQIDDLGPAAP